MSFLPTVIVAKRVCDANNKKMKTFFWIDKTFTKRFYLKKKPQQTFIKNYAVYEINVFEILDASVIYWTMAFHSN